MNLRVAPLAVLLAITSCQPAASPTDPLATSAPEATTSVTATAAPEVTTAPTASASAAPAVSAVPSGPTPGLGGRLFDKFYGDSSYKGGFKPDSAKTKGKADGSGGPNGDGTLLSGGKPMLNDAGHDYRLKNLFGWDLKGKDGIYGPAFMNKPYVVKQNLLSGKATPAELVAMLKKGDAGLPSYAGALDDEALAAIAEFVVATRDRKLVHPDDVFELKKGSPNNYVLKPGGDATRGKALIKERCSACHGDDGTKELFDDGEFSLGSHARQKAYEDWLKISAGQPGSPMGAQLRGSPSEMTKELLDIFAALCDRTAFPLGKAKGKDVPNGDPRCGAYLK